MAIKDVTFVAPTEGKLVLPEECVIEVVKVEADSWDRALNAVVAVAVIGDFVTPVAEPRGGS